MPGRAGKNGVGWDPAPDKGDLGWSCQWAEGVVGTTYMGHLRRKKQEYSWTVGAVAGEVAQACEVEPGACRHLKCVAHTWSQGISISDISLLSSYCPGS